MLIIHTCMCSFMGFQMGAFSVYFMTTINIATVHFSSPQYRIFATFCFIIIVVVVIIIVVKWCWSCSWIVSSYNSKKTNTHKIFSVREMNIWLKFCWKCFRTQHSLWRSSKNCSAKAQPYLDIHKFIKSSRKTCWRGSR